VTVRAEENGSQAEQNLSSEDAVNLKKKREEYLSKFRTEREEISHEPCE
jgi:hypothetical protein